MPDRPRRPCPHDPRCRHFIPCPVHAPAARRTRYEQARHYGGSYQRRAKAVRDAANADPTTRCSICGELGRGDEDPWQAHHVDEGNPDSELAPAHRSCNASWGDGTRANGPRRPS